MSIDRSGLVVDAITRDAQRRAADPRLSAWVSANAGAGKTKVLTDRVVRLLLAGSLPGRILCLTFTKAAAANMSIRVFQRLGRWVTLDEDALREELTELTGTRPSQRELQRARRLFAHAVETPGGLKIETLHALCERLLHLFPFEANVPARFVVLDDNQAREAFELETDNVLADAIGGHDPRLTDALAVVGPEASGETLRAALRSAMSRRELFSDSRRTGPALAALFGALGLTPGTTPEAIEQAILNEGLSDWPAVAERLRTGKATDEKLADALIAAQAARGTRAALDPYRSVFFTDKDEPRAEKSLGTKSVPEAVKQALLDEQARLIPLFEALRAAHAVVRTQGLFTLAAEIHRRVEAQKARLGALDFDDLIHKTLDLLTRVDASWVLYKLDKGVDHVLIDEAQDTNPQQWDILRRITAEFAAGEGAREGTRTRFAVGDPKQSIYSFQGAEPREFEQTRRDWKNAAAALGDAFADVALRLSFRSTAGILGAVDAVFGVPEHFRGLSFEDQATGTVHSSARGPAPGAVELWCIEEPAEESEPDAWAAPVDAPETNAPGIVVARRIARAIRDWTTIGDACGRVWRPGDVLVLVRKRSLAFVETIRALKALGVPVAGQDRLEVAAHIAVADLVAIGRAGLLPADDLTLATALKTPLVGLDDEDLVRIAARRPREETLEDALHRHAEAGEPAAIRALAALGQWIALAANEGPFGFYANLLGPMGGRARLVARLGGEAGDAIDVFLATALQAENGPESPSLAAFLSRYEERPGRGESGHTVKRDLESGRDEVRVMTVHGAKGLEAPVVVVIDGCEPLGRNDPVLLPLPAQGRLVPPVWSSAKSLDCPTAAQARAQVQARALEEHNRLLYVAMTRAADHLVIAPYRGATRESPQSWCEMVRIGLEHRFGSGEALETAHGPIRLWRDGQAGLLGPGSGAVQQPVTEAALPDWLERPVEPGSRAAVPLAPSRALAAADEARPRERRQPDAEARRRGILVHALMEHLPRVPAAQRSDAATRFVDARAPRMPEARRDALIDAVLRLMEEPDLAPLFSDAARAEVAVSGLVAIGGEARPVHGRVDRMAVLDDAVLFCDFKTGRPPAPDTPVPADTVLQLALYARLLGEIYPDRRIAPLLVWTSGPLVRRLDADTIEAALDGLDAGATA